MQQNSKCWLCGDGEETITQLISERGKLAQKEYKTRHWELCKKLKFGITNNPESVLENEMHKLLWDFEMQTGHLISARRPHLIIINKKNGNLQNCRLCYTG